ncbi:hypothetical protein O9G_001095 [Rozella allomycis CSF55]|uniref:BAH domain-containing protein n=1 Tax=Rozella allomycis (strain CSF55) TaxID=988480 RepID=A0A075AN66_ROZAC|nr:hypothetical protein O9G_001095 [Rozella allomycis CSF55]|eukprot:EPZ31183.1 hypothetical protein O9G_001095 [Rozella allomycis CSF55]
MVHSDISYDESFIEKIDYKYIENDATADELDKMVTLLRSGKIGFYPDLLKQAEAKLLILRPEKWFEIVRNRIDMEDLKEINMDILNSVLSNQLRIKGNEALKSNDLDEAINMYSESLKLNESFVTLNNRSLAYYKREMFKEAEMDAERSLRIENTSLNYKYYEAIEDFLQLLSIEYHEEYLKYLEEAEDKYIDAEGVRGKDLPNGCTEKNIQRQKKLKSLFNSKKKAKPQKIHIIEIDDETEKDTDKPLLNDSAKQSNFLDVDPRLKSMESMLIINKNAERHEDQDTFSLKTDKSNPRWLNELYKHPETGNTHYEGIDLFDDQDINPSDKIIKIGDIVYLLNINNQNFPYIGLVKDLYETNDKLKCVQTQWFYRRMDIENFSDRVLVNPLNGNVITNEKFVTDDNEIFLSEHCDINYVGSITRKCYVYQDNVEALQASLRQGAYNSNESIEKFSGMLENDQYIKSNLVNPFPFHICNLKYNVGAKASPPEFSILDEINKIDFVSQLKNIEENHDNIEKENINEIFMPINKEGDDATESMKNSTDIIDKEINHNPTEFQNDFKKKRKKVKDSEDEEYVHNLQGTLFGIPMKVEFESDYEETLNNALNTKRRSVSEKRLILTSQEQPKQSESIEKYLEELYKIKTMLFELYDKVATKELNAPLLKTNHIQIDDKFSSNQMMDVQSFVQVPSRDAQNHSARMATNSVLRDHVFDKLKRMEFKNHNECLDDILLDKIQKIKARAPIAPISVGQNNYSFNSCHSGYNMTSNIPSTSFFQSYGPNNQYSYSGLPRPFSMPNAASDVENNILPSNQYTQPRFSNNMIPPITHNHNNALRPSQFGISSKQF